MRTLLGIVFGIAADFGLCLLLMGIGLSLVPTLLVGLAAYTVVYFTVIRAGRSR